MACAAYGQAAPADAEAAETATRLVNMHRRWGPALNTPDASIFLTELSRSGPIVKYRLHAKGLPHDNTYTLMQWPVTQKSPTENLSGITLDQSGQAICAGKAGTCGTPDNPDDPIDLVLSPARGEPFRFALISTDDKKLKAFLKVVPVPIEAKSNGCTLAAILLMPRGELVELEGSGFQPDGDLQMEVSSGKEHQIQTVKAAQDGTWFSAILPYVKGARQGTTRAKAIDAKCSPELSFEWGRAN